MEPANRKIVVALAFALGLCLLVIAFLVGRLSAKPDVVTLATPASNSSESTPLAAAEPPAASTEAAAAAEAATPLSSPTVTSAPLQESAPMPSSAGRPMAAPPERQQVTSYFTEIDRIEDMGAGDPQAFASSMMQSLSSGDFTDFDKLLEKARGQKQRLLAIAPPSSCAEHHRLALVLSADSVSMLERLKAALMKGDTMALMGIASDGKALETRANQLKAISETIKRQGGV